MKIIAYTVNSEDKLVFGRPTFWSWLRASWRNGGLIKLKPIKGYEKYLPHSFSYQLKSLRYANERIAGNPIADICWAERGRNQMCRFLEDEE